MIVIIAAVTLYGSSALRERGNVVTVDRATVVTDIARRSPLTRSISATGSFEADHISVVEARVGGTVREVFVRPGMEVAAGDPIVQLDDPTLTSAILVADEELASARADLRAIISEARASAVAKEAAYQDAEANLERDNAQERAYRGLHDTGLVSSLAYTDAVVQLRKTKNAIRSAESDILTDRERFRAKIAAATAKVAQAVAEVARRQAAREALLVRAVARGTVQSVETQVGATLPDNSMICRVADANSLKAVLQVPEGDVHAVAISLPTELRYHGAVVHARVVRIAPAAQGGTVAVDVAFDGSPPVGARPSLAIDGNIIVNRLDSALSIERPANVQDNSNGVLFVLNAAGTVAKRVSVKYGVGSDDRVQILAGLRPGDNVIVSDTSKYAEQAEVLVQ